jgi:hypothetical protein
MACENVGLCTIRRDLEANLSVSIVSIRERGQTKCENRWHSSTLKMEAARSSKTSVDFQWTAWHYIPEDSTLHYPIMLKHITEKNKIILYINKYVYTKHSLCGNGAV